MPAEGQFHEPPSQVNFLCPGYLLSFELVKKIKKNTSASRRTGFVVQTHREQLQYGNEERKERRSVTPIPHPLSRYSASSERRANPDCALIFRQIILGRFIVLRNPDYRFPKILSRAGPGELSLSRTRHHRLAAPDSLDAPGHRETKTRPEHPGCPNFSGGLCACRNLRNEGARIYGTDGCR